MIRVIVRNSWIHHDSSSSTEATAYIAVPMNAVHNIHGKWGKHFLHMGMNILLCVKFYIPKPFFAEH